MNTRLLIVVFKLLLYLSAIIGISPLIIYCIIIVSDSDALDSPLSIHLRAFYSAPALIITGLVLLVLPKQRFDKVLACLFLVLGISWLAYLFWYLATK